MPQRIRLELLADLRQQDVRLRDGDNRAIRTVFACRIREQLHDLIRKCVADHDGVAVASTTGFDQSECLNGIQLENLALASTSDHELPADVLPFKGMRLVDPKNKPESFTRMTPAIRFGKASQSKRR